MKSTAISVLLLGLIWGGHAKAAPLSFNCSAPVWHPSHLWQFRPAGAPFRVRGRILATRLDPLPADTRRREGEAIMTYTLVRGAEVTLVDDDGSNVTFSVSADPAGRTLAVGVTTTSGDRHDGTVIERLEGSLGGRAWIPFELSVEAARVVLRAGTREIPLDIALRPATQIMVSCTGGEFWFRDLELDD
jgi:hypothetical protein